MRMRSRSRKIALVGVINTGGVVGAICTDYIRNTLEMEYDGSIMDLEMDPIVVSDGEGIARNIVRVYKKDNLFAVVCDINFLYRVDYYYKFAKNILDFVQVNDIDEIVLFESFKVGDKLDEGVYLLSSHKNTKELEEIRDNSTEVEVKLAKNFMIPGINAAILNLMHAYNKDNILLFSGVKLMADVGIESYYDIINFVSEYTSVDIEVEHLRETYDKFIEEVNKKKEEFKRHSNLHTDQYIV